MTRRTHITALAVAIAGLATSTASAAERYVVQVESGKDPRAIAEAVRAKPRHVYTSAIDGFAAELNQGQVTALRHNPHVERVAADQVVSADATTQTIGGASTGNWGLDRIDQRNRPLNSAFTFTRNGTGVRVYVLDSGIATGNAEFQGRAVNLHNATSGTAADCNGHGTHVAGIVGSKTFGVAKNVQIRGVKVLSGDCTKNGWMTDIIAGMDWVKNNGVKPAVVNMSFGSGANVMIDMAADSLSDAGFFVVAAAGNDNADACTKSPARAAKAFAVAASTRTDAKASFSNWGPCVQAYAPGNAIRSTLIGGNGEMSGTSMAAPHVAGVAALIKQGGDVSQSSLAATLRSSATTGVITGNPAATPNRLLFTNGL